MYTPISGQALIDFRVKNKITQRDVANHLGVSVNTVSRWEIKKFQSIKLSDLLLLLQFYKSHGLKVDYTKTAPTIKTD